MRENLMGRREREGEREREREREREKERERETRKHYQGCHVGKFKCTPYLVIILYLHMLHATSLRAYVFIYYACMLHIRTHRSYSL